MFITLRLRSDGNLALQNGVSFLDQLLLDRIFLDLLLPELGCILALSDLDLLLEVNLVLVLLKFGQLLFDLASLVQVLDGFLALNLVGESLALNILHFLSYLLLA